MFENLFSKPTTEDLLKVIMKEPFKESKANTILETIDINSIDNDGKSFLHHVCSENISEPIKWLVKNGINKELEDYYDESALMSAIKNDSFKSFNILLESGYDVDKQDRNGRTILQNSLLCSDLKFFKKIVNYTKNIDNIDKNGRNVLFDAVYTGNQEIIKELLSKDIAKDLIDDSGKPAFLLERVISDFDLLKLLVTSGFDISLKDDEGNNLLYYIIKNESINAEAIDYAIENKRLEVVKILKAYPIMMRNK